MRDSKDSSVDEKASPSVERWYQRMSHNAFNYSADIKESSPVSRRLDFKAEGKSADDRDSNFFREPEGSASAKEVATISGGYEQVYTIMKIAPSSSSDYSRGPLTNEVLFRCGNWCYRGHVNFGDLKLETGDIPAIIPCLQRQQSSLRYFCKAEDIPASSPFHDPIQLFNAAREFCASEIVSNRMVHEFEKWSTLFPWVENEEGNYFELSFERANSMTNVAMICSKTYYRGLILISIYCDKSLYFLVQDGEGEQALLDIRFPDVSKCGQGLHLSVYNDDKMPWNKLTLWRTLKEGGGCILNADPNYTSIKKLERPIYSKHTDLASSEYEQTYCVMKGTVNTHPSITLQNMNRDVFFRFGSWCYAGRVQLIPSLTLSDIPFLIPTLRVQQSKLDFYCESRSVPTNSPFHAVLEYIKRITPYIESLIVSSEDSLRTLIDGLSKKGMGDRVKTWLEGDSMNSFFEFKCNPSDTMGEIFKDMDVVVSKTYHASGIITIMIFHECTYYISLQDGGGENPLLDSKFPDVSGKGRGYQLQTYPEGIDGWSALRKVGIWQTADALKEEFMSTRASNIADAKEVAEKKENHDNIYNPYRQEKNGDNLNESYSSGEIDTKAVIESLVGSSLSSSDGDLQVTENHISSSSTRDKLSINVLPDSPKYTTSSDSVDHKGYTAEMYANSPARDRAGSEDFISRSRSNSTDFHMLTPSSRGHSFAEAKIVSSIAETSELHHDCMNDAETPAVSERDEPHIEEKGSKDSNKGKSSKDNTILLERKVSINVARPHHVPKLESLSTKMEELRRSMLSEGLDSDAPWDATGKPRTKRKKKDKKKKEKDQGSYQEVYHDIPGHGNSTNRQKEVQRVSPEDDAQVDTRKKFTITNVNGKYIIETPDAK